MKSQLHPDIQNILACPSCGSKLTPNDNGNFLCLLCNIQYERTGRGALDLRLKAPKNVQLFFDIGKSQVWQNKSMVVYDSLPMCLTPNLDLANVNIPHHLTRELLSYFPKATDGNSIMLDLGCGDAIHRKMGEHIGFNYIGLDYEDPHAPILGDAHALPFQDNSIDFLLSIAVLEHIQYPFVMMREAFRVLKLSSVFIGTVSFLEPFHANSYYHHTHLGLYNSLQYGGFDVEILAGSQEWLVFDAQARMAALSMFPRMPKFFSNAIIRFPKLAWKLWWKLGALVPSSNKRSRRTSVYTGAFSFIARKTALTV